MRKKITLEEIRQIQLEILTYIDTFCKNNNIPYVLNYGTLLGAIRHKGYIPWDDDIDISMSRQDYDRFIELFKHDKSKYKIISLETNKDYFNNFIKIEDIETEIIYSNLQKSYKSGIFIDIFPIDFFEDRKVINIGYILESLKLICISPKNSVIHNDSKIKNIFRLISWYLLKPINPRVFANLIEKVIKKYTTNNPTYGLLVASKSKEKSTLPVETTKKIITLEFEGLNMPAPAQYDEILSHRYGEYMQLPPEEDRITPHDYEAFKIEN